MAETDFLKILREVRGTEAPGAPYTDGIYYDIIEKPTDADGVTQRVVPGMYPSMQYMYDNLGGIHTNVNDVLLVAYDLAGKDHNGNPYTIPGSRIMTVGDDLLTNNYTGLVATNIDRVKLVGDNITSVNTNAFHIPQIDSNAANITNITIVGEDLNDQWTHIADYGSITTPVTGGSGISNITVVAENIDAVKNAAGNASAAAVSAAEALVSENAAKASETNAKASEVSAKASEVASAASETNAATSETNANTSATAAASSEASAATIYDDFDDRYLGTKSVEPTLDNDGDALKSGSMYFDISSANPIHHIMKVYNGSLWTPIASTPGALQPTNNLGDVADAATSRVNLGLEIGVDIAAYDSTLEIGATKDQTGAEIKTAYEAEAKAFTDTQFDKLAAIEVNATADQTATEIEALYEGIANTNKFTDTAKADIAASKVKTDLITVTKAVDLDKIFNRDLGGIA